MVCGGGVTGGAGVFFVFVFVFFIHSIPCKAVQCCAVPCCAVRGVSIFCLVNRGFVYFNEVLLTRYALYERSVTITGDHS